MSPFLSQIKQRQIPVSLGRSLVYGFFGMVVVFVATPGVVAAAISQGYQSDETIASGTLVSGNNVTSEGGKAVLASTENADNLLGVVVGSKDATLAVAAASDQLQVATSGTAEVFVSDLGGDIKAGDPIGVSAIRGVGMKALSAGKIVGSAQGDVKYTSKTVTVTASDGKKTEAKIGTVPVVLQVAYYVPPAEKSPVPKFLQVFANSIAGKQVSLARLLASALIILAATITIAVLLYSAVRSTMVSIGRNPLAQSSIYRGLWQVIFTSIIIFVAALGSAYVVLTR